jgi:hypothetical protein
MTSSMMATAWETQSPWDQICPRLKVFSFMGVPGEIVEKGSGVQEKSMGTRTVPATAWSP